MSFNKKQTTTNQAPHTTPSSPPPPLVLGTATFNSQYNEDPTTLPVKQILLNAFSNGITAVDTSPYYGPSEILIGKALADKDILDNFSRSQLRICTKVGRIEENKFDYSPEFIRFSVKRSIDRLFPKEVYHSGPGSKHRYLDVVYLHDVEFMSFEAAIGALRELFRMKKGDNGHMIMEVGISGYPIEYLYRLAKFCADSEDSNLGPLDCVLSYCHLNLQNVKLLDYYKKLKDECHVGTISNASVLGMSLLTNQTTKEFHPCSTELRNMAADASEYCLSNGVDIADLATRYALCTWGNRGPTVIGISSTEELEKALSNLNEVQTSSYRLSARDLKLVNFIQKHIFGKQHLNETWSSGKFVGGKEMKE